MENRDDINQNQRVCHLTYEICRRDDEFRLECLLIQMQLNIIRVQRQQNYLFIAYLGATASLQWIFVWLWQKFL